MLPVRHRLKRNLIANMTVRRELDYVPIVCPPGLRSKPVFHVEGPQPHLLRRRIVANGFDLRPYQMIDSLGPQPPMRSDSRIGKL